MYENSLAEIGLELGCSPQTVVNIEKAALIKCRRILERQGLRFDDFFNCEQEYEAHEMEVVINGH